MNSNYGNHYGPPPPGPFGFDQGGGPPPMYPRERFPGPANFGGEWRRGDSGKDRVQDFRGNRDYDRRPPSASS